MAYNPRSVLGKLLNQAMKDARGVTLQGIEPGQIVQVGGLSATTLKNELPDGKTGILIAPVGSETIDPNAGSNERDEIVYPIGVLIVAPANEEHNLEKLDQWYEWRRRLIDHFRHNPLSLTDDNATIWEMTVDPLPIIDSTAWAANWFLSAFMLRCKVLETRGNY